MSNALLRRPLSFAVIDDSAAVRRSLSVLLGARGYSAMSFEGAEEFLESPAKSSFDFLLVDYKLDGMLGTDLLKKLRQDGVTTPAAMLLGWETSGLERLAHEAGFVSFIRKPMLNHTLFSVINSLFGHSASEKTRRAAERARPEKAG